MTLKALILTGGKSTRMGTDKASLTFQGKTLLDRLIDQVTPLTKDISLSVSHDTKAPAHPTLPQINDLEPNPGPLGGLAAAFAHSPDAHWLLIGCDLPLINTSDLEKLINAQTPNSPITAFLNPIDNQPEPLCTLYNPQAHEPLLSTIENNRRCARKFIASLTPTTLSPTTNQSLLNLNRPELIPEAEHLLTRGIHQKEITLEYFAKLSQEAGTEKETIQTTTATLAGLWEEARLRHQFTLDLPVINPALNNEFADWQTPLADGQTIAFMPPFAGG